MVEGHVLSSSDSIDKNFIDDCDFLNINKYITLESISYDGKQIKWQDSYESLQDFVAIAFCQQGNWRRSGSSSKRFDAYNSDLSMTWYLGKLNTLTFKGTVGESAKACLIDLLISPTDVAENITKSIVNCNDNYEYLEGMMLEIEILNSKVDSMQALNDSCGDPPAIFVSKLSKEVACLHTDLGKEKAKKSALEHEVNRLKDEILVIKSCLKVTANIVNNTD